MVDERSPEGHQQVGVPRVLLHQLLKKRQSLQTFALAEECRRLLSLLLIGSVRLWLGNFRLRRIRLKDERRHGAKT